MNRTAGIFVHEQVQALAALGHDVRVVSPKGWAPPLRAALAGRTARCRGLTSSRASRCSIRASSPCPGRAWATATPTPCSGRRRAPSGRVHLRWPFHVIHAHMLVPDGWAAARVGAAARACRRSPRRTAPTSSTCPPGARAAAPRVAEAVAGARPGLRRQRARSATRRRPSRRRAGRWRSCRTAPTRGSSCRGPPSEARARLGLPGRRPDRQLRRQARAPEGR